MSDVVSADQSFGKYRHSYPAEPTASSVDIQQFKLLCYDEILPPKGIKHGPAVGTCRRENKSCDPVVFNRIVWCRDYYQFLRPGMLNYQFRVVDRDLKKGVIVPVWSSKSSGSVLSKRVLTVSSTSEAESDRSAVSLQVGGCNSLGHAYRERAGRVSGSTTG